MQYDLGNEIKRGALALAQTNILDEKQSALESIKEALDHVVRLGEHQLLMHYLLSFKDTINIEESDECVREAIYTLKCIHRAAQRLMPNTGAEECLRWTTAVLDKTPQKWFDKLGITQY